MKVKIDMRVVNIHLDEHGTKDRTIVTLTDLHDRELQAEWPDNTKAPDIGSAWVIRIEPAK